MKLARPLQNLIEAFERLPGIGPRTAQRLTFYLLHVPQEELEQFAQSLVNLKKQTVECRICYNISETNPCSICADSSRDQTVICVVESPIDILAIEKTGKYKGVYHVLHGRIDPLNNIRPEDLRIRELLRRLKHQVSSIKIEEIILALNPDMEGEATCLYLVKAFKVQGSRLRPSFAKATPGEQDFGGQARLKVTRLAYGLPTGASIEYADELTLSRALEGRRELS